MPQGVYRKKIKSGKRKGKYMHFRNGKLISKASYDRSKSSKKGSTRKGMIRKTSRRAYTKVKRGNNKMKKSIPHPSVTGMASGLAIASYLNAGKTAKDSKFGTSKVTEGVIKDITDGELGTAFSTLSHNAINLIGSDAGRKDISRCFISSSSRCFCTFTFP